MILLGKPNVTESCGLKMKGLTVGWVPLGGQTQSPYILTGLETSKKFIGHSSAGGSSVCSASGVAVGIALLSIGTECSGSLITLANSAALYGLKCGPGAVDDGGRLHYTYSTDYIGGMAKTVDDLSAFVAVLIRPQPFDTRGGGGGLRVGFTGKGQGLFSC